MPGCWKMSWCLGCSGSKSRKNRQGRPKISSPVHLLLKPPDAELLGHAFRQKHFRRSRPCNLCHQPVKNVGISCRVCKYTCHKSCEPKNASEPLVSRQLSSNTSKQTITRGRASISPIRRMAQDSSCAGSGPGRPAMDLSFVTERILSLSFQPDVEALEYRHALHQAAGMLQTKHGDNYMVFNLSLPRKEIGHWNQRVLDVGWPDALAPPLERLCSVCRALDSWLQADPQHVAVLHSKCGLQRVGVVVAAYCEYTGLCPPHHQDQSLDRFAMKRFLNERVGGIQSPSDKRYVEYFAGLLSGNIQVNSSPLFLDHVTVVGIPAFQSNGGCRAFFKVYQGSVPVHTSSIYNLHDSARHFTVPLGDRGLALRGDILVKCYHRHSQRVPSSPGGIQQQQQLDHQQGGRETIFSLQFHTCAVTQHTLVFQRQDLDDACRDLRFPLDGSVRLHFSSGQNESSSSSTGRLLNVSETHTRYTVEPSSGDPIVRWDSYDTVTDSSVNSTNADDMSPDRLVHHTYGPLDGSLYARVLKGSSARKSPSPLPADHYRGFHHLLNSPHVASTDSGISSAGLVRSGAHQHHQGGGSSSASPPHSSSSPGGGLQTPSPIQVSRMPSIVETRAEVHQGVVAPPPTSSTSELDQLLSGMLMNVQNIPDIRPERRAHFREDIDVDSIQVTFDLTPSNNTSRDTNDSCSSPSSILRNHKNPSSSGYVYESDTVRRAAPTTNMKLQQDPTGARPKEVIPYHAREDSKPFTYGVILNGSSDPAVPTSPSVLRRNWKESSPTLGSGSTTNGKGLESPSLVRKFSTGSEPGSPPLEGRAAPRIPPPTLIPPPTSPRPIQRKISSGSSAPVATSSPRLDTSRQRSISATERTSSRTLLEESSIIQQDSSRMSNDSSLMGSPGGTSWLQRQQQKLRERKDSMRRAERHPQEIRLLTELRSSSQFKGQQQQQQQQQVSGRPGDDGYLSDATLFSELDMVSTSREGSPDAATRIRSNNLYTTPLHINTSIYQQSKMKSGGSSPTSPLPQQRSASLERSGVGGITGVERPSYINGQLQTQKLVATTLTRQKSDMSHDRERPFVAVKRAHEQQLKALNMNNNNNGKESAMSWNSSMSGDLDNRPVTPAFPVVPRTPYLNVQHHHFGRTSSTEPPSTPTGGLPPKSPTTQRKDRSPSPSPSTAYLTHQSRRSLTQEPQDVSPIHVNFVKDTSRYWYKPNIAREDAINMLKDQVPGTFIVRDSNSFPGAFGLALKVATPPPHAAAKVTSSSDPSAELVRHFLIEPTSKGVRIKGCSNEPVFGSLSALIYQHSVTPLALPINLVLPDSDLVARDGSSLGHEALMSPTSQLLSQGAACNLLYLFTMDTESLTGPQAIQRTMSHLLDLRPLPVPTVVHFKVSAQGITLTDNERKLFFRRHYPVSTVSHCGLDPEDRRWMQRNEETGLPISSNRCFGFIARKPASKTDNQCHIFAELEAEQPATAIVNFVTKVMMVAPTSSNSSKNNV